MILVPQLSEKTQQYFISSEQVEPTVVECHSAEQEQKTCQTNYLLFAKSIPLRDLMITPFFGESSEIGVELSTLNIAEVLMLVKKDGTEKYLPFNIGQYPGSGFYPAIDSLYKTRHLSISLRNIRGAVLTAAGNNELVDDGSLFGVRIIGSFDGSTDTLYFDEVEVTANDETYDVSLVGFRLRAEGYDTDRTKLPK